MHILWEVISARHVGSDMGQTHGKWHRPDMGTMRSDIGQTWEVVSARHMGSGIGQTREQREVISAIGQAWEVVSARHGR
jgi:hypothetical protein